jgi:hypothetical protein
VQGLLEDVPWRQFDKSRRDTVIGGISSPGGGGMSGEKTLIRGSSSKSFHGRTSSKYSVKEEISSKYGGCETGNANSKDTLSR